MPKIKRICLYGGPSCSKSVIAAQLFAELKKLHFNIELISEYIKTWAHIGYKPKSFDQLYVLSKQIHKEDRILPHLDFLITDSPILLNAAYSKYYNCPFWKQAEDIAIMFEEKYPALHILLDRTGLPYNKQGRFQDESQAKEIDNNIKLLLEKYVEYVTIPSINFNKIFDTVLRNIND
jgi:nicotinamide riboside kinase